MPKINAFQKYSEEYDNWFEVNQFAFLSELRAVREVLPETGRIIEIGIGSGIFAEALGIKEGIEPSEAMRLRAKKKGLKVLEAVAEDLPYANESVDAAVMITTVCFVDDVYKSFGEVYRILKKGGCIILGFVDKESPIGREYLLYKDKSKFYKEATFFSAEELIGILQQTGFTVIKILQTVFGTLKEINNIQSFIEGYGKGSFVVIKARK